MSEVSMILGDSWKVLEDQKMLYCTRKKHNFIKYARQTNKFQNK